MKKPSANKIMATFGNIFIGLIVYIGPMVAYLFWLTNDPKNATKILFLVCWYYFEIRTFANWLGKKYKEIV